jgi:hypothetical protein
MSKPKPFPRKHGSALTPVYEMFEDTASHTVKTTDAHDVYQEVTDDRAGIRTVNNHDGIQCLWRCPTCKQAMTILPGLRISFGSVLTVPLICPKCVEKDNVQSLKWGEPCPIFPVSTMKEPEDRTL